MKITHTEIYRFSIPMEPFTIATGTMDFAQNTFIRIYTDEGLYGVGECSAFPMIVGETQETCLVMAREFAKLWKGKNPLDIEERLKELHLFTAFNATIKSAFDMALYDIAAKNAGLPLYKFLGGAKRKAETDITIGIGSPDEMAAKAVQYKEMGAHILKIKLGKKAEEDIERVRKIRLAVGEEMLIRVDANQGWSFEDAVTALNGLEPYQIEFCEQPMRTWFDTRLPELIKKSPVKIMADESCYHHYDAQRLISTASCDAINIKFAKSGGINESLKIYKEAEQNGIPCMIGGMLESRIAASAFLHFAYACPEIKLFDMDTCFLGHLEDPATGGIQYDQFHISIEDRPGIGADANEAFLAKCEKTVI